MRPLETGSDDCATIGIEADRALLKVTTVRLVVQLAQVGTAVVADATEEARS